ncbi:hypothetical protein [Proteus phage RP7]|nr:hypothetical protein [Proteus phage RP7]
MYQPSEIFCFTGLSRLKYYLTIYVLFSIIYL